MAGAVRATARDRATDRLIVGSFTRAAATEIAGRGLPIDREQVGTLHALAYRAIGRPPVAEEQLSEWNREHPPLALTAGFKDMGDNGVEYRGETDGDALLMELDVLRARMVPHALWPSRVRSFERRWTDWKQRNGCIDFTDMIALALEQTEEAPGRPVVGFYDETQDFTALELKLVRHWGRRMDRIVLAGDDDQAQAPDSKVFTTEHGWVRMDALDPDVHRLVSYDLRGSELNGSRRGHEFRVAVHREDAPGLVVSVDDVSTTCTQGHLWWSKIDQATAEHCVVYLMRRGTWWRVGWCQLLRSDGVFHLGTRARLEGADAAWVLRVTSSRSEASMWESTVAARYGLPTALWRPTHDQSRGHMTAEVIHGIFSGLEDVMKERGERCLEEHGRSVRYPAWEPGQRGLYGSRIERVRACNLLTGVHLVPRWYGGGKKDVSWLPVEVATGEQIGEAYSLAVEPYRTYLTDGGIVTSNCIYSFKGAYPDAFLNPPIDEANKRVLSQSYRVPRAVHAVAERWIRRLSMREPKEYLPRDADGVVRQAPYSFDDPDSFVRAVAREADAGRTVGVFSTCAYMLDKVKHGMRDAGLPYANPLRRSRGDWNPLRASRGTSAAERLLAYLIIDERIFGELSRLWTGRDVKRWTSAVKKQGIFRRGAAGMIDGLPDRELRYEEVAALFESEAELEAAVTPDLDWFRRNLLAASKATMEFPVRIVQRRGAMALLEEPRVHIGTIHCSPPDELVLTKRGEVPMGELRTDDCLVSYDRTTNTLRGLGGHSNARGYAFERSVRPHSGLLVIIESSVGRTRVTPDHRVLARFADSFLERWCVYLMRRGNWWRVGYCTTGHRPYRSGGLNGRLATEQAEAGWILSVHDSREAAALAEAYVHGQFGVPGLTFEAMRSAGRIIDSASLHRVHEATSAAVEVRAKALLDAYGLDASTPLYVRSSPAGVGRRGTRLDGTVKRNMRANFITEAANLVPLSGRVEVLTTGIRPTPVLATVSVEAYEGPVYGLDVPPYHYYVSGGHVVHNSYKGGERDCVFLMPDVSLAGMREWDNPRTRDNVIRQMYVGMTRAKEELVICDAASPYAVPPEVLLRG